MHLTKNLSPTNIIGRNKKNIQKILSLPPRRAEKLKIDIIKYII